MTHAERLMAALAGAPKDRPPYALTASLYGARLSGIPLERHYSDPAAFAEGQARVMELLDPDIALGPFALCFESAALGAELAPQVRAAPNQKRPAFESAREALAAPWPALGADPYSGFLLGALRAVAEGPAQGRPLAAIALAPCDLPILLIGLDAWIECILFERDLAEELARRAGERFIAYAEACKEAGAAMMACPMMLVNPRIMDEANLERIALPVTEEYFSRSPLPICFHHGGMRLGERLARYARMPGVAGFLLGDQEDLAAARAALGPGRLIMGTISGPKMGGMPVSVYEAKLKALLADRRGDEAFAVASSGAELPWDADPALLSITRRVVQGAA
jgi:uroporphyrinogen decarboxylase